MLPATRAGPVSSREQHHGSCRISVAISFAMRRTGTPLSRFLRTSCCSMVCRQTQCSIECNMLLRSWGLSALQSDIESTPEPRDLWNRLKAHADRYNFRWVTRDELQHSSNKKGKNSVKPKRPSLGVVRSLIRGLKTVTPGLLLELMPRRMMQALLPQRVTT